MLPAVTLMAKYAENVAGVMKESLMYGFVVCPLLRAQLDVSDDHDWSLTEPLLEHSVTKNKNKKTLSK